MSAIAWGLDEWGASAFGWGGIGNVNQSVTGLSASTNVGTVLVVENVSITVSTVASANGWGRATWGSGGWNEAVTFPDISMVGAVGSTFVNADANVSGLSGAAGIKFLGDEEIISNNNLSVTGFSLSGSVGAFSITLVNRVSVTGVSSSANLSNVGLKGNANVNVTGLSAVTNVGNNLVWGTINTSQIPNWQEIKEAA